MRRYDGGAPIVFEGNPRQFDLRAPQVSFIRNGVRRIGDVLRYENLEAGIAQVFSKLGFQMPDLPWLNESPHLPWRLYYDKPSRYIVERLYREDMEAFGYSFDGGT